MGNRTYVIRNRKEELDLYRRLRYRSDDKKTDRYEALRHVKFCQQYAEDSRLFSEYLKLSIRGLEKAYRPCFTPIEKKHIVHVLLLLKKKKK